MDPVLRSPPSPASIVMAEIVPNVLFLLVPADISSLSLGLIPIMVANLFKKDVLFACESSFFVSGVLPVTSFPMPIGENSIVFAFFSVEFGIGVVSVVFFSMSSILCSGVSTTGVFFRFSSFSSVASYDSCPSLLFRVITMLTETFFFFNLGIIVTGVCLVCPIGRVCLGPILIFSCIDFLVFFMVSIYNFSLCTLRSIYSCKRKKPKFLLDYLILIKQLQLKSILQSGLKLKFSFCLCSKYLTWVYCVSFPQTLRKVGLD